MEADENGNINCSYCIDCVSCTNCISCTECIECTNTSNSKNCYKSNRCNDCTSCSYCRYVGSCSDCISCTSCVYCVSCTDCKYCDYNMFISNCSDCYYSTNSDFCSNGNYLNSCSRIRDSTWCVGCKYNNDSTDSNSFPSASKNSIGVIFSTNESVASNTMGVSVYNVTNEFYRDISVSPNISYNSFVKVIYENESLENTLQINLNTGIITGSFTSTSNTLGDIKITTSFISISELITNNNLKYYN